MTEKFKLESYPNGLNVVTIRQGLGIRLDYATYAIRNCGVEYNEIETDVNKKYWYTFIYFKNKEGLNKFTEQLNITYN